MSFFSNILDRGFTLPSARGTVAPAVCLVILMATTAVSVAQEPTPTDSAKTAKALVNLAGAVFDEKRSPLPKATVYVDTAAPRTGTSPFCPSCYVDCGKHQMTNSQGRFRIPTMDSSLLFRLLVVDEGYQPRFVSKVDPLRSPIKVVLKKDLARSHDPKRQVAGRVLDTAGHPVVGATVEPNSLTRGNMTSFGEANGLTPLAITNARGEFRLDCPSASCIVTALVKARGLAPRITPKLTPGAHALPVVRMEDGTTVEGTVQDASGHKMAGVVVQIVPTDLNAETFVGWFEIATDRDGKFSLPNIPANQKYVVCVRMDSLTERGMGTTRQTISTGKQDKEAEGVRLTVQPAAVITGRVVLTDGVPIPAGTRIMLARANTWDQQQTILAPDGTFTFRGAPQEEDLQLIVQVRAHHILKNTAGYDSNRGMVLLRVPTTSSNTDIQIHLDRDAK